MLTLVELKYQDSSLSKTNVNLYYLCIDSLFYITKYVIIQQFDR